jgi:hypothetical protein
MFATASCVPASQSSAAAGVPNGPPAGRAPCDAPSGASAEQAALRCYETRVKPGLASLAHSGAAERFRFGSSDHLDHTLRIPPIASTEKEPLAGLAAKQSFWNGMPSDLLTKTTALGDASLVADDTIYEVVTLALSEPSMPTDGGILLAFIVERATKRTVLVLRLIHG